MGPSGQRLIEKTYEIYSRNNEISFEEYMDMIIMNDDDTLFNDLLEQAKIELRNEV